MKKKLAGLAIDAAAVFMILYHCSGDFRQGVNGWFSDTRTIAKNLSAIYTISHNPNHSFFANPPEKYPVKTTTIMEYIYLKPGQTLIKGHFTKHSSGKETLNYTIEEGGSKREVVIKNPKQQRTYETIQDKTNRHHLMFRGDNCLEVYKILGDSYDTATIVRCQGIEQAIAKSSWNVRNILVSNGLGKAGKTSQLSRLITNSEDPEFVKTSIGIAYESLSQELGEMGVADLSAVGLVTSPETWAANLVSLYAIGKTNPDLIKGLKVKDIFGRMHTLDVSQDEIERRLYAAKSGLSEDNPYATIENFKANSIPDTAISWEWENRQRKESATQKQQEQQAQMSHAWQQGGENIRKDMESVSRGVEQFGGQAYEHMKPMTDNAYHQVESGVQQFQSNFNRSVNDFGRQAEPVMRDFQRDVGKAVGEAQRGVDNFFKQLSGDKR